MKSKTTGHEKLRFTAVLAAMAYGRKLSPMLIFRNLKNVPKGNFPRDCVIAVAKGGCMTTTLMEKWTNEVWRSRAGSLFHTPAVLVMDRHASHTQEATTTRLVTQQNTNVCFVPGSMTPLLQPCDATGNKPFKANIRRLWEDWLENSEQEFTRSGRRRPAGYDLVAQWVVKAWRDIPQEMKISSFTKCGISADSNKDDLHSNLKRLLEDRQLPDDVIEDEDEIGSSEDSGSSGSDSDSDEDVLMVDDDE